MKRANPYPGLHKTTKRLADGSRRAYYYAWKGGPPIAGEYGSAEFAQSFREAVEQRRTSIAPGNTLQALLDRYQRSRGQAGSGKGFLDLAERTRADYAGRIRLIEREFGTMPLEALAERGARAILLAWRDQLAATSPRQADYAWTVLARALAWGKDRGLIAVNPCERAGRLYSGSRAEHVWSDADEAAFRAVASPELCLALTLALWTGQREGDLLRLTWAAYDGRAIRLRQGKTGAHVEIPAGQPLRAALEAAPRRSPLILTNSRGRPWTADGFRASFAKARARAEITGRTFNDLRGTAVTRLAVVGCTPPEISAITGHAHSEINTILEKHYLARDPRIAKSAIRKLETGARRAARKHASGTNSPNRPPNRSDAGGPSGEIPE